MPAFPRPASMKFLYDFFPVVLFFLAYKFYGHIPQPALDAVSFVLPLRLEAGNTKQAIYLATTVGIAATFLQVVLYWLWHRRFERMHLISLAIFILAGGLTLSLQNPVFVYWKPTILNGLFALIFLGSHVVGKKTIVERLLAQALNAPASVMRRLNLAWVGYFTVLGVSNIYVAYNFSEETWVNFKLFGWLGLTFLFVIGQALYVARYASEPAGTDGQSP
jgi:intracellular septation protein